MKILIMGLPGSGKSTLAEPLAEELDAVWLNADAVREKYNDWDFTKAGRVRQAQRMRHLADGIVLAGKIAVVDFICPTYITRLEFDADFTVWMDTINEGKYEDTNAMFEKPENVNYHVSEWFNDTHEHLAHVVDRFLYWKSKNVV